MELSPNDIDVRHAHTTKAGVLDPPHPLKIPVFVLIILNMPTALVRIGRLFGPLEVGNLN